MKKFIKDILKEPGTNKYSLSRAMAVILTFSYLFGYFYILIKQGKLEDIPDALALLIASLYGINKVTLAWQSRP